MSYPRRVLISFSQLLNTLLNGHPDETTSSRVGRAAMEGKRWAIVAEKIIDFFLGAGHCRDSLEGPY
jgi:hypothetical protein